MWRPETKVARQIREAIYEDPDGWKKATKYKAFTNTWSLEIDETEKLKRVPKEFDTDFPYADELRMKSFIAGHKLTQKTVTSPEFDVELAKAYKAAASFAEFLCKAIGLPY